MSVARAIRACAIGHSLLVGDKKCPVFPTRVNVDARYNSWTKIVREEKIRRRNSRYCDICRLCEIY